MKTNDKISYCKICGHSTTRTVKFDDKDHAVCDEHAAYVATQIEQDRGHIIAAMLR